MLLRDVERWRCHGSNQANFLVTLGRPFWVENWRWQLDGSRLKEFINKMEESNFKDLLQGGVLHPACITFSYVFSEIFYTFLVDGTMDPAPWESLPSNFGIVASLVFPPCSDESEVPQGQGLLAFSQGGGSFRFVGYCSCAQNDRICAWMDMPDTELVLCRVLPYSSCFCDLCQTCCLFYKQQVSIFLCKESFKKQLASRWFLSLLY